MDFSRQEYWSGLPFPSPWFNYLNIMYLKNTVREELDGKIQQLSRQSLLISSWGLQSRWGDTGIKELKNTKEWYFIPGVNRVLREKHHRGRETHSKRNDLVWGSEDLQEWVISELDTQTSPAPYCCLDLYCSSLVHLLPARYHSIPFWFLAPSPSPHSQPKNMLLPSLKNMETQTPALPAGQVCIHIPSPHLFP